MDDSTGIETPTTFQAEKMPPLYIVAALPRPGMLVGREPNESNPETQLHLKGNNEAWSKYVNDIGAGKWEVSFNWHWDPFNQLLAKIAHSFAAAVTRLEGFEQFLPPLVLGQSRYYSHFIGGVTDPTRELAPPNDLTLEVHQFPRNNVNLLMVCTTIFGSRRFPTYEIVVVRITDLDLVRTKITLATQRSDEGAKKHI